MQPSRVLTGALVVGAVAVASVFAAAPAGAASLPLGQKITVIDAFGEQFSNADPADALLAPVGTPPGLADEFESGVDVDDSGLGFAIANGVEAQDDYSVIYRADANTGQLSDGKRVVIDAGGDVPPPADACGAIDYTNGVILAVCDIYYEGDATAYIGTIDISGATALLTPFHTLSGEAFLQFRSIAVNPVDGVVWGFEYTYDTSNVYQITKDALIFKGEMLTYYPEAADFDRSGQLWFSAAPYNDIARVADTESVLELATFDFATNQAIVIAPFGSNDPYEVDYPAALTVWGALAATGTTVSIAPALAASGVLLLGALLAAGTMVLRRRNADA